MTVDYTKITVDEIRELIIRDTEGLVTKEAVDSIKGKKALVVPNHKEIDKGTLLEIIRQAELTRDEFFKLLK